MREWTCYRRIQLVLYSIMRGFIVLVLKGWEWSRYRLRGGGEGNDVTWSKVAVTSNTEEVSSTTQRTCAQGIVTKVH